MLKYETFMCTYGDGLSDINIDKLLAFHQSHGKLVTMTVARPSARFGVVETDESQEVKAFREKPVGSEGWVNAGFFVMEPGFLKYIDNDSSVLEREPMERVCKDGQLMAYHHHEFWKCMDMKKDVAGVQRHVGKKRSALEARRSPHHLNRTTLCFEGLEITKNKKVFVTGHTGFKGSWLSAWLLKLGADVTGYAQPPLYDESQFELLGLIKNFVTSRAICGTSML